MSLRRSGRSRNPTDDVLDTKPVPLVADALRKRKRVSDEASTYGTAAAAPETPTTAQRSLTASKGQHTPEPPRDLPSSAVNGTNASVSPSSSATSPGRLRGRPRGRPMKASHDPAASVSPDKPNGGGHQSSTIETRRSTRGTVSLTAKTSTAPEPDSKGAPGREPPAAHTSSSTLEAATARDTSSQSVKFAEVEHLAAGVLSPDEELWLGPEDAEKLRIVIDSLAPELLQSPLATVSHFSQPVQAKTVKGKARQATPATLAQALDGRTISLRQLRAYFLALRAPLLARGECHSQDESKNRLANIAQLTMLLSLVDELALEQREPDVAFQQQQQPASLEPKEEQTSSSLERLLDAEAATEGSGQTGQYALHMRLPGGDYFTRAVELSPDEVSQLQTGLADIIAIQPRSDVDSTDPVPTLGERLYRNYSLKVQSTSVPELREKRFAKIVPSSNLYYGPYASFAPTYDSSSSSISQAASNLIWATKTDKRAVLFRSAWQQLSTGTEQAAQPPQPPKPAPAPAVGSEQREGIEDLLESLDPSIDVTLLRAVLAQAEQAAELEDKLNHCASLLARLQSLQERRLQKLYAHINYTYPRATCCSKPGSSQPLDSFEPNQEEQSVAREVFAALGSILRLRPRSRLSMSADPPLVPARLDLRALSHSVAVDPAFSAKAKRGADANFWGTLDPALYAPEAATQLAGKVNAIVPSFASNDTVCLDASAEHRATNRSLRQRGIPIGVSRDHGPGLLDRVAELDSRNRQAGATLALNGIPALLAPTGANGLSQQGLIAPSLVGMLPGVGTQGFALHGSPPFNPVPIGPPHGYQAGSPPLPPAAAIPTSSLPKSSQQNGTTRGSVSGVATSPASHSAHHRSAISPLAASPVPAALQRHPSQQNLRTPGAGQAGHPVRPY